MLRLRDFFHSLSCSENRWIYALLRFRITLLLLRPESHRLGSGCTRCKIPNRVVLESIGENITQNARCSCEFPLTIQVKKCPEREISAKNLYRAHELSVHLFTK